MNSYSNHTVIILGLSPQGLSLLRTYSKSGYNCIAIGLKFDVGIHSKYGKIYIVENLSILYTLLKKLLNGYELIHITSDIILNYLIDNHPELFLIYNFYPELKNAIIFCDKLKTFELANKLKIPTPKTWKFDQISLIDHNINNFIVKWKKTTNHQQFKTKMFNNAKELSTFFSKFEKQNLIIQEYIDGLSLSYAGYWLDGKEIVSISVHQKRQYPMGITSYAQEINNYFGKSIEYFSSKLFSETNFFGFCEAEFKVDLHNDKIYLIEVNPRPCGWIKLLMNDFKISVINQNSQFSKTKNKSLRWTNIGRDLKAIIFILLHRPNIPNLKEFIFDYLRPPLFDIFDIHDFKPFIYQFKKCYKYITY